MGSNLDLRVFLKLVSFCIYLRQTNSQGSKICRNSLKFWGESTSFRTVFIKFIGLSKRSAKE